MTDPRAITAKEGAVQFLSHMAGLARYWATVDQPDGPKTPLERCNGLVFSILATIDGSSSDLPALNLVPAPHADDRDYCISVGENYWTPEPINADVTLHEQWSRYEPTAATVDPAQQPR